MASSRQKKTISLTDLANGNPKAEEQSGNPPAATEPDDEVRDSKIAIDQLKDVWNEFTEQRKNQVGEYHLLKQEFSFEDNLITIHLSNSLEEPILQGIKTPLTEYLRERLGNNKITIVGMVAEVQSQKIAYTNKEKFEHLAEKNPILKELKERLGLDPDF